MNNFDGLRLAASLLVLVSHQFAVSGRAEPLFLGINLGTFGVLIFFAMSGYLVTTSWRNDPNLIRFFLRRLLRLWPALAVCLVACLAFVAIVMLPADSRWALPQIMLGYAPNFVFIWRDGDFFQGNPYHFLNGPIWTIALEMQCYIALAALGFGARKYLRVCLLVISGVILVLYISHIDPANSFQLPTFFQLDHSFNLPIFFLLGALVCVLPLLQNRWGLAGAGVLGVTFALFGPVGLAWACILPVAVLYLGNMSLPWLRSAGRWGDLSYGIYLWAWPVQQIAFATLGDQISPAALLCVTLAVVLPLSYFSWHLIEKRSLRLKPDTPAFRRRDSAGDVALPDPAAGRAIGLTAEPCSAPAGVRPDVSPAYHGDDRGAA